MNVIKLIQDFHFCPTTDFGIESNGLQKFLNIFKLANSNFNEKEAVKDKHEQVTG